MTSWLKRHILGPLLELLRQGISPNRLALCVAIGVVIGNIPILGLAVMREGIGSTVVVLREAILHAGFAWCLIAPLATLLLYGFLSPMFKKAAAARTSA